MTQFHFDPDRIDDETALPGGETFEVRDGRGYGGEPSDLPDGWYWWACFPGCMPDGPENGPYETEDEAIAEARADAGFAPAAPSA